MRKITRILLSLLLCLALAGFAACGAAPATASATPSASTEAASEAPASTEASASASAEPSTEADLPIAKEPIKMTLYMGMATGSRQVHKSAAEVPVVQEMMKQTGITFEFVHPPENDDGTFFTTMIASGTYPDLISNNFTTYPGGPDGAIEDGVLINMNDLIAANAPNFNSFLETYPPDVKKRIVSDKGTIIRFGTIFNPEFLEGRVHGGFMARADLLEKYGITELPETYDEYEAMFKVFKDNGIDVPLSISNPNNDWQFSWTNALSGGFGVMWSDFQIGPDGKVAYSRVLPGYRDFLAKMADWYKKGYISSDFLTSNGSDAQKTFKSGRGGISLAGAWELITAERVGQEGDKNFKVVGLPYPRQNKGDKVPSTKSRLLSVDGRAWFVSAQCKYPTEAVQLIDYLYRPEVMKMTAWGVNTDTETLWEEKDGKRTFTDFMKNNPDFDFGIARDRYTINAMQVLWDEEMEIQQYDYPVVHEAWANWAKDTDDSGTLPNWVTMTADESREQAEYMSQIKTYGDEMVFKFITGAEPIDKFDEFVAKLKELNLDQATALSQAAYDRYMQR